MSLRKLRYLRKALVGLKKLYLRRIWGMDIHPTVEMSLSAKMDFTNPRGVHVDAWSYLAFNARILAHDMTRNTHRDTWIGKNCFIGGNSLILPGVRIGDSCIVAAGSVVTKSVPSNSIVAGNPARILRQGVELLSYGRIPPEALKQGDVPVMTFDGAPAATPESLPETAPEPAVARTGTR